MSHLMTAGLPDDLKRFVSECVASGKFQSEAEVMHESLRRFRQECVEDEQAHRALKAKLERASANADLGKFVDPDEAFARIRAAIDRRARELEARSS